MADPCTPASRCDSERDRILLAVAELVAERGYEGTTVEAIVERSATARSAFDRWFQGKGDCLVAAQAAAAGRAFGAAAEAFLATGGAWPEAVHNALHRLLELAAATPALTRLYATQPMPGGAAPEPSERTVELFTGFLLAGGEAPQSAGLTAEMIAGGIFELIRSHAIEGRLERLPDALPSATILTLTPFIGEGEAQRISRRTPG